MDGHVCHTQGPRVGAPEDLPLADRTLDRVRQSLSSEMALGVGPPGILVVEGLGASKERERTLVQGSCWSRPHGVS